MTRLSCQVPFRVSEEENEWINQQVHDSGLSKNAWLRRKLGLVAPDTPGFKSGAANPRSKPTGREAAGEQREQPETDFSETPGTWREQRVRQLTAQGMTTRAAENMVDLETVGSNE